MTRRMSQTQLDAELRSHFGAAPEPPAPPSLGDVLNALPDAALPVRRSRGVAPAFVAGMVVAFLAAGAVMLPLALSRPAGDAGTTAGASLTSSTGRPGRTSEQTAGSTDIDASHSPDASASATIGEDPDWWRAYVVYYTNRPGVSDWASVQVTADGSPGCTVYLDKPYLSVNLTPVQQVDLRLLPGSTNTQNASVAVPAGTEGAASWSLKCWRDGAGLGPEHVWTLQVTVQLEDSWTLYASVGPTSAQDGTISFHSWVIFSQCQTSVTPSSGSATVTTKFTNFDRRSGTSTFHLSGGSTGPVAYEVTCTSIGGTTRTASGSFDLPSPTPTPAAST